MRAMTVDDSRANSAKARRARGELQGVPSLALGHSDGTERMGGWQWNIAWSTLRNRQLLRVIRDIEDRCIHQPTPIGRYYPQLCRARRARGEKSRQTIDRIDREHSRNNKAPANRGELGRSIRGRYLRRRSMYTELRAVTGIASTA